MSKKAKFISFEGGEGCGKTTHINLLAEYFSKNNIDFVKTREPGGAKSAEQIRDLLVNGDKDKWLGKTEILLHYAARNEHVERLIKPKLENNESVICDRFFDSTIAYQGYGHGVDLRLIKKIQEIVLQNFQPDITIILDIDPKIGLKRAGKRIESLSVSSSADSEGRYESFGLEFHQKVRKAFLDIAEKNPKRCFVINADDNIENIHKKIIDIVELN